MKKRLEVQIEIEVSNKNSDYCGGENIFFPDIDFECRFLKNTQGIIYCILFNRELKKKALNIKCCQQCKDSVIDEVEYV